MKSFVANTVVVLVFLGILLASAGRLDFGPAWAYAAIGMLTNVAMRLLLRARPGLAGERARPGPGAAAWDKRLLGLGGLLTLAMLVVAGLDAGRFGWTPRPAWPVPVLGALVILAGTVLFLAALRENPFFSSVVRVQRDRGHVVCDSGPYRVVRHPGNLGMALGTAGFPLLFGSAWSALPALLALVLMAVRTRLEDALLARELTGYEGYRRAVRFRLVPGIW